MNKDKKVTAVILGGGIGKRMKLSFPKQFVSIKGKPIIIHTIEAFQRNSLIDEIIVVMHKDWIDKTKKLLSRYGLSKFRAVIRGGKTRQESSYNGVSYLKNNPPEIILIHDVVRPFVSQKIIEESVRSARKYGAVTAAVKTIDTITEAKNGFIQRMPDRKKLWNIQTPQGFKYNLILKAHESVKEEIIQMSDDAGLVIKMGKKIKIIEGDYNNVKLTTKMDIEYSKRNTKGVKI